MRHTAERIGAEVGNLAFVYLVLIAMTLGAVLCGIAKEECPL
jgi:hypothetical protein